MLAIFEVIITKVEEEPNLRVQGKLMTQRKIINPQGKQEIKHEVKRLFYRQI